MQKEQIQVPQRSWACQGKSVQVPKWKLAGSRPEVRAPTPLAACVQLLSSGLQSEGVWTPVGEFHQLP